MTAGCTRRSSEIGRIAASNVTAMLPARTTGSTLKRGDHRSMKVNPADPCRDADAEHKSDHRARRAQRRRFRGEKSIQQAVATLPALS